jgi:hypothetical protein
MKQSLTKVLTKAALPALFVIGSLGAGAALVSAPAGAATKPAHTPSSASLEPAATYKGTVKTVKASDGIFTFKVGSKTYVVFARDVKFTKGSAADIKVGASVTVKGSLVKGKTMLHATSISA